MLGIGFDQRLRLARRKIARRLHFNLIEAADLGRVESLLLCEKIQSSLEYRAKPLNGRWLQSLTTLSAELLPSVGGLRNRVVPTASLISLSLHLS